MPPQPGSVRPEPPQPVVALLVVRRRGERLHAHVARVERSDEPLDRAALAGGVPALEQHAQRRADPLVADQAAEHEPQLQQPRLRASQPLGLLLLGEGEVQIEVIEAPHN